MSEQEPHVWMLYDWDYGPYLISVHATAEDAAQQAAKQGYGKVGRLPFGADLSDAVEAWEKRA